MAVPNKNWLLALRIREQNKETYKKTFDFSYSFLLYPSEKNEAHLLLSRTKIAFDPDTFPFYTWQMCPFRLNPGSHEYILTGSNEVQFTEIQNDIVRAFLAVDLMIDRKRAFYDNLARFFPKGVFVPAGLFTAILANEIERRGETPIFSGAELNQIFEAIID